MTTEETADALVNEAEQVLAWKDPVKMSGVAWRIKAFLDDKRLILLGSGSSWRVDQLEAGYSQLTGNAPGSAGAPQSPAFAGLDSFLDDSSSLDNTIGQAATEQAKRIASGTANVANAAAGGLLKSPAILAAVIVGVILLLSWSYRSFK